MAYNPVTDFLALWRNGGTVAKVEMPGLDYVVAALARMGLISVSVSGIAPVANQDVTAWLQPAVPTYSAEGVLRLWDPDAAAYAAATPALLLRMLQASADQLGTSWYVSTGGPPANVVGLNGDFAIRDDEPGGIYGPKAAGAWPADPLPGTTNVVDSDTLDLSFGTVPGSFISRGLAVWSALLPGAEETFLTINGGLPEYRDLQTMFDLLLGATQGSILYRNAADWVTLAPGVAGQLLSTNGAGANPSWVPRTAEFPSGTEMLFRQTNAPVGWTKNVGFNDYALRVTSGAAGSVSANAFSAVFAQTAVGNTTISTAQMPSHSHDIVATFGGAAQGGAPLLGASIGASATTSTGGGGSHTHSVNLTLSYVDVIIASKD